MRHQAWRGGRRRRRAALDDAGAAPCRGGSSTIPGVVPADGSSRVARLWERRVILDCRRGLAAIASILCMAYEVESGGRMALSQSSHSRARSAPSPQPYRAHARLLPSFIFAKVCANCSSVGRNAGGAGRARFEGCLSLRGLQPRCGAAASRLLGEISGESEVLERQLQESLLGLSCQI